MLRNSFPILALCFALSSAFSLAQTEYAWKAVSESQISNQNRRIVPQKASFFYLNLDYLKSTLETAGNTIHSAIPIALPDPSGQLVTFKVYESPILHPELGARYPHIKTYTAIAVHNPIITAKLDVTDFGFHAMIFAPEGTYYIDPVDYYGNTGMYQVYFKQDFASIGKRQFECKINNEFNLPEDVQLSRVHIHSTTPTPGLLRTNGTIKRNYRLALACTGEYAQAVTGLSSPSQSNVLSAMVTTMNRVNGVYERELSITLTLIANNDDIIYTNPATDPYTATSDVFWLALENQDNLEALIGVDNFDIGHIFNSEGGGIAFFAGVCDHSIKATAATGIPEPSGDPFDVDYVCHEIGHQFAAAHSFNNCGGNESDDAAYEPGSGSTIMGYAGICGSQNLQNNSDDYFHPNTLNNIHEYITGEIFGGVGTCATISPGASTTISIPGYSATYYIPTNTAFEVEAPDISWPDGMVLYEWDQFNLGQLGRDEALGATALTAPVFRSYPPSPQRSRSFPHVDSVHRNVYNFKGERTPEVARNVKLRLTAKGIAADGFGSFNTSPDEITVNYINTGAPFTVTYPNDAISVDELTTLNVTWDVAGTNTPPIATPAVNIYLSIDGGNTYPYLLAESVPNDGSAEVTIPEGTHTTQARIKVKGAGNVFYDVSNQDFTITNPSAIADHSLAQSFTIYPNPVTEQLNIEPHDFAGPYRIRITDMLGRKMYDQHCSGKTHIQTGTWARGAYFIHISDSQAAAVFKIICQ